MSTGCCFSRSVTVAVNQSRTVYFSACDAGCLRTLQIELKDQLLASGLPIRPKHGPGTGEH